MKKMGDRKDPPFFVKRVYRAYCIRYIFLPKLGSQSEKDSLSLCL
jgi:hypothetical protein